MRADLGGAWLKLCWAKEHFYSFEKGADEFAAQQGDSLVKERDPKTGNWRVKFSKPPPSTLSLIAGDCIQNCRAALDFLAYELGRVHKMPRSDHKSITFPYRRRAAGKGGIENTILFKAMRALSGALDGSRLEHLFARLEHLGKELTNECMHCGDCALGDVTYLCPVSQCPKGQRNGPCGGSFEGWCEAYPNEKKCIYVRAYDRLKHYGEEDSLGNCYVPPVNYDLRFTSSWLNYYMGRDHTARRLGIKPPESKKKK